MNCPDAAVIMVLYWIKYRQQNQQVQAQINLCKVRKKMISLFVEPREHQYLLLLRQTTPNIHLLQNWWNIKQNLDQIQLLFSCCKSPDFNGFSCVNKQGGTGSNSEFFFLHIFQAREYPLQCAVIKIHSSITKFKKIQFVKHWQMGV